MQNDLIKWVENRNNLVTRGDIKKMTKIGIWFKLVTP